MNLSILAHLTHIYGTEGGDQERSMGSAIFLRFASCVLFSGLKSPHPNTYMK